MVGKCKIRKTGPGIIVRKCKFRKNETGNNDPDMKTGKMRPENDPGVKKQRRFRVPLQWSGHGTAFLPEEPGGTGMALCYVVCSRPCFPSRMNRRTLPCFTHSSSVTVADEPKNHPPFQSPLCYNSFEGTAWLRIVDDSKKAGRMKWKTIKTDRNTLSTLR